MTTASLVPSSQVLDHNLRKLADLVTEIAKISSVQAINAHMNPTVYKLNPRDVVVGGRTARAYPSVGKAVAKRFARLDDSGRKASRIALGSDPRLTESIRRFTVDMRSATPTIEQIDLGSHFAFVNANTFSKSRVEAMAGEMMIVAPPQAALSGRKALASDIALLAARYGGSLAVSEQREAQAAIEAAQAAKDAALNTRLNFRIHMVECIDETNPEWPGNDELAWGGASLDDKGNTSEIPEHYVGGGFHDGHQKTYPNPEVIQSFALDGTNYPKSFMVSLSLAEKDNGGFAAFIQELYDALKAEIVYILTQLAATAGAYIGSQIGGSVGSLIAGPLGTIIGAVAGAVLGALVAWLVSALQDDVFPPEACQIVLPAGNCALDADLLTSRPAYFNYRAFGGHYRISYDWELVRE